VTLRTLGNAERAAASSVGMHAYQHLAHMVTLESYAPDRRMPRSTRGPASHRKVRGLRGHLFTVLFD